MSKTNSRLVDELLDEAKKETKPHRKLGIAILKQETKKQKQSQQQTMTKKKKFLYRKDFNLLSEHEKETIKRLRKKEKKIVEKKISYKPNRYVELSNKYFSSYAKSLIKKEKFENVQRSIIKTKLRFVLARYISVLFFT